MGSFYYIASLVVNELFLLVLLLSSIPLPCASELSNKGGCKELGVKDSEGNKSLILPQFRQNSCLTESIHTGSNAVSDIGNSIIMRNETRNRRHLPDILDAELPLPTQVLDKLFSRVLFNTTMNYIIPLVKVTLPLHTDQGSTVHLAMQVVNSLQSAV
jgi:hypothetical protein